jgi:hypothetical protein
MAITGLSVEQLRQYLRQLEPGARAQLIAELERALLRGEEVPGGEVLLNEVRSAVREQGASAPRLDNAARAFFRPLEPFLIDDDPARKHLGRIARGSLEPIWAWISRDLAPAEAKAYSDEVTRTLAANDAPASERLAHGFQNVVVERIHAAFAALQSDDKARRRMVGQIGTPNALDDVRDLHVILSARDLFGAVAGRLPEHIRNLADSHLDHAKAMLDSVAGKRRELLPYGLIMVMGRLAAPWQLIRLAVKAAESDDAARIAGSPYAAAVNIVLAEVERMLAELKADLKRGSGVAVISLLKSIHDTVRGLRTELDLSSDSAWGRRVAAVRAEIASLLKAEIESMPGRVRRLLRPRAAKEIVVGSALDADDVAETEALIEFVGACRNYASELAISEMTLRTYNEVQQYLDTGTRSLLESLRAAGEGDRRFRQSQVDAAVRFCAKVFGKEYASLLAKAAEVAVNSERKVAAKA